jgi:flagellar FliL protein
MSNAAAAASPSPKGGKGSKKKLLLIVGIVLLVAVAGGVGAVVLLQKKAQSMAEADDGETAAATAEPAHKTAAKDPKAPPVFVPLDSFTVNLADRQADRYAQVGITLEVGDTHVAEEVKTYMPAIRNNILLALGDKTAAELVTREGKDQLARQIVRETSRALGAEVEEPEAEKEADASPDEAPRKVRKRRRAVELPVKAVHFSNFIIQ